MLMSIVGTVCGVAKAAAIVAVKSAAIYATGKFITEGIIKGINKALSPKKEKES